MGPTLASFESEVNRPVSRAPQKPFCRRFLHAALYRGITRYVLWTASLFGCLLAPVALNSTLTVPLAPLEILEPLALRCASLPILELPIHVARA
jgi:hypothetical protein